MFDKSMVREPGNTGVISKERSEEPIISHPSAKIVKSTFTWWCATVVNLGVSAL